MESKRTMRNRAARIAATASMAGILGISPAPEPPPTRADLEDVPALHGDRASERIRAAVEAESARLRAVLDARESGRDWSELLERKRTLDAALAPIHLLLDAAEWQQEVDPAGSGPDLLRALRIEWREGPVTAAWSSPDAPAMVRRSLATWLPPGGRVVMDARTCSERWVRGDAPVALAWTLAAEPSPAGTQVHARCNWRAPIAEPARIDFPLGGDGFDLWVDRAGARYRDDRGQVHAERWEGRPVFNNPPELYAAFDALRTVAALDRPVRHGASTAPARGGNPETAAGRDEADRAARGRTCVRRRTISAGDGRVLRTEEWRWDGARLRSVIIDQHPLRLLHHAEQAAVLVTEVAGEELSRTEHRPSSEIMHLVGGVRIELRFRDADPERDVVHGDPASATVPDRIEVASDAVLQAWTEFGAVRVGSEAGGGGRESSAGTDDSVLCRQVAQRIADAIEARSGAGLQLGIHALAEAHHALGIPRLQRLCEWELLASRVHGAGMASEADQLVVARLMAEHAEEAGATVRRALERGDRGFGARVAAIAGIELPSMPSGPGGGVGTERPVRRTDACDPAALGVAARTVFEAIAPEVRALVPDDGRARELTDALCGALAAEGPGIERHGAEQAPRLRADARAVLAPSGWNGSAESFARLACRAASVPAPDPARVESARRTWDACADAVLRAARRAVAPHRTGDAWPALEAAMSEAASELRARRALVGNAFVPELDGSRADANPDLEACERRAHSALHATCEHEAERLQAVQRSLGGPLAEARAEAVRRRVVRAAVEAAEAGAFGHGDSR